MYLKQQGIDIFTHVHVDVKELKHAIAKIYGHFLLKINFTVLFLNFYFILNVLSLGANRSKEDFVDKSTKSVAESAYMSPTSKYRNDVRKY